MNSSFLIKERRSVPRGGTFSQTRTDRANTREAFECASPTSGYGSQPFGFCLLGRRSWATTLKPSTVWWAPWCPEPPPSAICICVEEFALSSVGSLCTCCPSVHAFGCSNKHSASFAHCCSFQGLCSSPVRALFFPFSIALFSSMTHLVLFPTRFSAVMVCWLFSR